jgi:2-polyprenyl-3-methyl-5-hydroxy-6-metoxy-1,4-benzoquinol methylase
MGRYIRQQYEKQKEESETPRYFKELLIYNYLYKGPVLEWYLRIKIRLEKNYQLFHDLLPKKGRILDIGCGYGFMSYMLHFSAPARDIIGYDYDEEKIAVANHCFSRDTSIHFVTKDVTGIQISAADAIIISDTLHYLQPDQQEILIRKCMRALRAGGTMIIRDGDRDLKKKHERTKWTEFFSTRFFAFNKTSGHPLQFLSGSSIREMAANHQMDCRSINDSAITSNRLFIITHQVKTYEKV